MHVRKAFPIFIVAAFLVLAAACTTTSSSGGATTPTGGGTGSGGGTSLVPGPVVTTPAGFEIEYQVNRDQISTTPDITVFFRGGKGQIFLQKMTVQMIREDGITETKELVRPYGGQLSVGDFVKFRGSLGTDRIIIAVTINNVQYKIHDG
ncbi:MAG: hypothetical protein LUQ62_06415, partial [Methanomicrobiales archaeon]|nr:hypothetical protein [Methanomicrobiales archaeon]